MATNAKHGHWGLVFGGCIALCPNFVPPPMSSPPPPPPGTTVPPHPGGNRRQVMVPPRWGVGIGHHS